MPFTLDQLNFLGLYVGIAIPPEFIENKKRAEEYKKRSREISAKTDEIRQRSDGAKLQELVNQAAASAANNDFSAALKLLDQAEAGLAAPDAPPTPVAAEPKDKLKAPGSEPAVAEVVQAQLSPLDPSKAAPPPALNTEKQKFEKRWTAIEPGMVEVAENLKVAAYQSFPKLQSAADSCRDAGTKIKAARE